MRMFPRLFAFGAISFYLLAPSAIIFAAAPPPPKPTCNLSLNTSSIQVGGTVTLKWTSTNATSGAITNVGNVGPSGQANLLPPAVARTTYIGSFTGPGGTTNCSVTVSVSFGNGGTNTNTTPAPVATPAPTTITPNPTSQSGLVPCGYDVFHQGDANNTSSNSTGCQACDLATLVQTLINFMIGISIPIAAALFAWAGALYFSSAGDHHKLDQAKGIFMNVFIGFVIVITAWLVINTLLHALLDRGQVFSGGSWFSVSCAPLGSRPVNANIGQVLGQILGSGQVNNGSISTNGYNSVGVNTNSSAMDPNTGCKAGAAISSSGECLDAFGGTYSPYKEPSSNTTCYEGDYLQNGQCLGTYGEKYDPFTQNKSTYGPEGNCPAGYTYAEDSTTVWCQGPGGANDWKEVIDVPGSISSTGGPAAQCTSATCSADAYAAAGFSQTQANVMSCIAMTENPSGTLCNGNACGTNQIMLTVNKLSGPSCGGTLDCPSLCKGNNGVAIGTAACQPCVQAALNTACNNESAQALYQQSGYAPWTTQSDNTKSAACVAAYGGQ